MEFDFFHIKKVFEHLLLSQPNLSIVMGLIGLLLWVTRPKSITGAGLILVSLLLLCIASLPITGSLLGYLLEKEARSELQRAQRVTYIVVLNNEIPEAARVRSEMPGTKLILLCPRSCNQKVDSALKHGIRTEDIIVKTGARDTEEQASQLQPILKNEPFILCTSALHTPRAVRIFNFKGMNPIPAPSEFIESQNSLTRNFRPSRCGWDLVNRVLHEYIGLLWVEFCQIGRNLQGG